MRDGRIPFVPSRLSFLRQLQQHRDNHFRATTQLAMKTLRPQVQRFALLSTSVVAVALISATLSVTANAQPQRSSR